MFEDLIDWSIDNYNIATGAVFGGIVGVCCYVNENSDELFDSMERLTESHREIDTIENTTEKISEENLPSGTAPFTGLLWGSGIEYHLSTNRGGDYDPEFAVAAAATAYVTYNGLESLGGECENDFRKEIEEELEDEYEGKTEELFTF